MFQTLHDINIDWMGNRRWFIGLSVLLMLLGLGSAVVRQATGRQAFNLGVDFKGGTVVTARFKQRPNDDAIRATLVSKGINDAVVQPVTDRLDTVLIKVPLEGEGQDGRVRVREALNEFGQEAAATSELEADPNAAYKIVGTDAVGAIAGAQLRNKAIAVTLAALVGILIYIAARFEWTYGAAAVIAVFHDVLVTLGFFSIFQIEVSLNVIASVLALVLFGGDVLRAFSLALFIGVVFGTYSSIAIASPIMVWWEQRIEASNREATLAFNQPRVVKATRTPKSAKQSLRDASKPLH